MEGIGLCVVDSCPKMKDHAGPVGNFMEAFRARPQILIFEDTTERLQLVRKLVFPHTVLGQCVLDTF